MFLNLATLAAFLFAVSLAWLLGRVLLRRRQMAAVAAAGVELSAASAAPPSPLVQSLAALLPQGRAAAEEIDRDLRRAGRYVPAARPRLLALRNALTVLAVLVGGTVAVVIGPRHPKAVAWTLAGGLMAAVLGFTVPRLVLALNARRRVERIRSALPDALDTISMCLQGGISLQECLIYVGRELMSVHADLALELLLVGQQSDMNSFEFAIQQFAARINAPEVVALASLVTQNQRLGVGIVDSIHEFTDNLRLKRRQLAEAKANMAELYLLFPVILCLVPAVVIILWGPSVLSLIDFLKHLGPATRIGL